MNVQNLFDKLGGYLVLPLAALTAMRVNGGLVFAQALKLLGTLGGLARAAQLRAIILVGRPAQFALFWNSVLAFGASVLAFRMTSGQHPAVGQSLAAAFVAAAIGFGLWVYQRAAIPRFVRTKDGQLVTEPAVIEDGDGNKIINPRADEPMMEPGFQPGRLHIVGTWLVMAAQWASLTVAMILATGYERSHAFILPGVGALYLAYFILRFPLVFLGQVAKLTGGGFEATIGFLMQQLAVLAPGVTWDNVFQYVKPPDFFRENGPKEAAMGFTTWLLGMGLAFFAVLSVVPHEKTVLAMSIFLSVTNLFFAWGSLRETGKAKVTAILDRSATFMVTLGSLLAVPAALWHAVASESWKMSVAMVWDSNATRSWDIVSGQESFTSRLGGWDIAGIIAITVVTIIAIVVAHAKLKGVLRYGVMAAIAIVAFLAGDTLLHEGRTHRIASPLGMPIEATHAGGGLVHVVWKPTGTEYKNRILRRTAGNGGGSVIVALEGQTEFGTSTEAMKVGEMRFPDYPWIGTHCYTVQILDKQGVKLRESKEACVEVNGERLEPTWTMPQGVVTVRMPSQGEALALFLERRLNDGEDRPFETIGRFENAQDGIGLIAKDTPALGGWQYRAVAMTKAGARNWATAWFNVHKPAPAKQAAKQAAAPEPHGATEDAEARLPQQAQPSHRSCGERFAQLYRRVHGGRNPTCFQVASN